MPLGGQLCPQQVVTGGMVEAFYALDLEVLCGHDYTVQCLCRTAGGRPED